MKYKSNRELVFVNDKYKGNIYVDGQFTNSTKKDPQPFSQLLRWSITPNKQRKEKKRNKYAPKVNLNAEFLHDQSDSITWLGHASFHIRLDGKVLLTDPVFFDLSPFLKRRHQQPCKVKDFQQVDYVLLSHGHRDHLDKKTIKLLLKGNPNIQFLCPLGIGKILKSWGAIYIQEAAWFQTYNVKELKIVFLPAKHWNRRGILDYNKTLWGSFAIYSNRASKNIYFGGDTGFDAHFELIRQELGSFDNCLLPIGAYKPRFMMKAAHMSPKEAIEAYQILNGKHFIPMHFGTYDLADEPASEGIEYCRSQYAQGDLKGRFEEPEVGRMLKVI